MLTAVIKINLLAALGLAELARIDGFGPTPADDHAAILPWNDTAMDDDRMLVCGGVNKVVSGIFPALVIALAQMKILRTREDMYRAKISTALITVVVGSSPAPAAHGVEPPCGVRTPWWPAAFVCALVLIAFALLLA